MANPYGLSVQLWSECLGVVMKGPRGSGVCHPLAPLTSVDCGAKVITAKIVKWVSVPEVP
jgi:hypothetical protein